MYRHIYTLLEDVFTQIRRHVYTLFEQMCRPYFKTFLLRDALGKCKHYLKMYFTSLRLRLNMRARVYAPRARIFTKFGS